MGDLIQVCSKEPPPPLPSSVNPICVNSRNAVLEVSAKDH